jgi:dynein heavy chain 1, cytosolic
MYGGKIDNDSDFITLRSIVERIITPQAFEDGFLIVEERDPETNQVTGGLSLPNTANWEDFMKWVNDLPEREPPNYLGLPSDAEKKLLAGQANSMVKKLGKIMELLDEGEQFMAEAEA